MVSHSPAQAATSGLKLFGRRKHSTIPPGNKKRLSTQAKYEIFPNPDINFFENVNEDFETSMPYTYTLYCLLILEFIDYNNSHFCSLQSTESKQLLQSPGQNSQSKTFNLQYYQGAGPHWFSCLNTDILYISLICLIKINHHNASIK